MAWLSSQRTGDALGVLSHVDVPDRVDVIWGHPDTADQAGLGLAKIIERHPEVIPDLPDRLARMAVVPRSPNRIVLASADGFDRAVLRLDLDGAKKTWLLTAYERPGRSAAGLTERGGSSRNPDGASPDRPTGNTVSRRPAGGDTAAPLGDPALARDAAQVLAEAGEDFEIVIPGPDGTPQRVRAVDALKVGEDYARAAAELLDCAGGPE